MALTLAADLSDSKEAAAEISRYAATGDATFSTNTLELLEQQAFDLAAVYQRDNDAADLEALTKLTSIINKARNTRVRERHASVQEQKLQLRREELALKRELARTPNLNRNLNPNLYTSDATTPPSAPSLNGGTRSPSATATSRDAIFNHDAAPANQSASATAAELNTDTLNSSPSASSASPASNSDHNSRSERLVEGNTLVAGSGSQIEASSFLSTEALDETNRHAILLLAGKIKTHYPRDPEMMKSPLAQFYALTAPEIVIQAKQIAALSQTEWAAHPWNPENKPNNDVAQTLVCLPTPAVSEQQTVTEQPEDQLKTNN
jgi:hypothetical protein